MGLRLQIAVPIETRHIITQMFPCLWTRAGNPKHSSQVLPLWHSQVLPLRRCQGLAGPAARDGPRDILRRPFRPAEPFSRIGRQTTRLLPVHRHFHCCRVSASANTANTLQHGASHPWRNAIVNPFPPLVPLFSVTCSTCLYCFALLTCLGARHDLFPLLPITVDANRPSLGSGLCSLFRSAPIVIPLIPLRRLRSMLSAIRISRVTARFFAVYFLSANI